MDAVRLERSRPHTHSGAQRSALFSMLSSLPLPSDSLDLIPVPTLALSEGDVVGAANAAAAGLLGRGPDALAGTPFRDLVHADDRGGLDLRDAHGDGLRVLDCDGEVCYVRLFSRPVDGGGGLVCLMPAPADGVVAGISGGLIDATLLARAVHAADNSIVVADVSREDHPLVFVNRGFLDLTGYEADEVIGRNCRFLQAPGGARLSPDALERAIDEAHAESGGDAAAALRQAIAARETVDGVVIQNYTADGTTFWNELYLTPVEDEAGVSHYVGVQNDVTERVEAQRRFRRQATQLKDLFDAMPEPLGLIEAYDGGRLRHVLCNTAAADAFGLDHETEVGLDGLGFRGEARTAWIDAVHACEASGEPVVFEAPRSDRRTFEVTVSPVRSSEGRPDVAGRYFYLARDVSDGRRLERDVLRISGRELTRVAQDIHDGVGQTLVGASMLSSALASALRGADGVADDAERLSALVRSALAQLRQFALGLDPVDVDDHGVDHVLERLATDISVLFGVDVRYEPAAPPTDLPADEAIDVYRIAQEAITNAVRHGHAERVAVRLTATDGLLELVVEDDGDGISDAALTDADGMGLRNMRARARRLGGPLTVVRGPRGGTVLTVRADRTATRLQRAEAGAR